ncbi:MAG: class I SAM-dependent methyltransferase [Lentisphaeria bacterium]|nr:class I SAM-dependent methyltransferase [Lentisphaeria bacterium]
MSDIEKDKKRDIVRRRIFMKNVPNYAELSGLEIGALCSPLLTKEESNVKYYDIFPKETLIEHFQEFYPGRTFVDVDFVAKTRSLSEVLGDNKFDYFVANHVIEHIPDFIGFFKAVYESLNDGGKFFLAIPDRRFTFDIDRPETSAGHLIVDYENNGSVDAAEHILDALIYHYDRDRLNIYWSDIESQRYNFVHHHHVFNYENFLTRIIRPLIRMRYFPFSVLDCHYEEDLDNEFDIVLEKCTDWDEIHILGEKVPVQPLQDESSVNIYDFRLQMSQITKSGWFDPVWYLTTYPTVRISGLNPLKHYYFWGAYHGFNPSERFDSKYYLDTNPDVRQAGLNPLWHYLHNGAQEGRSPLPPKPVAPGQAFDPSSSVGKEDEKQEEEGMDLGAGVNRPAAPAESEASASDTPAETAAKEAAVVAAAAAAAEAAVEAAAEASAPEAAAEATAPEDNSAPKD